MAAMLRCPSCNEIILADSAECKYCLLPLNASIVRDEVGKFNKVSKAVTQANTIRSFNPGIVIVGILCLYLFFSGASSLQTIYIPLGGFLWSISWFLRFGKLQSKDPEFEPARAEIKRSIKIWSIGLFVYIICILLVNSGFHLKR